MNVFLQLPLRRCASKGQARGSGAPRVVVLKSGVRVRLGVPGMVVGANVPKTDSALATFTPVALATGTRHCRRREGTYATVWVTGAPCALPRTKWRP